MWIILLRYDFIGLRACALEEVFYQPTHLLYCLKCFAVCPICGSGSNDVSYVSYGKWKLWLDCIDAKSDQSFQWLQMPLDMFPSAASRIMEFVVSNKIGKSGIKPNFRQLHVTYDVLFYSQGSAFTHCQWYWNHTSYFVLTYLVVE